MKKNCEKCGIALSADGEAYVCSFECTFCTVCSRDLGFVCQHCAGELVRRPRRSNPEGEIEANRGRIEIHSGRVWMASFGIWGFVSVAATLTVYQMYRLTSDSASLRMVAGMEFSQILAYAPLTPLVFYMAIRYPMRRDIWLRQSILYAVAGLLFTLGHIGIRGFTPYGYWDPAQRHWRAAFWNSSLHSFTFSWLAAKRMFLMSIVDDLMTYIPIVVIAYAFLYYRHSQEEELRASRLASQLAKAHLQTLKNQMQPHFLFNTLHSISALMLSNVTAADRMMTSLSDLLRMSLEDNGSQLTTMSRELEFLSVYLEIEKARFEDRLQVELDIAPECLDSQVPHLLLQPLVENAVRHGISKHSQPGHITVSAKHGGDDLEIWIRDNGPGLTEAPEELFNRGLGLTIARERLRQLYGNRQDCKISNMREGGAEVYVRMPFCVGSSTSKSAAPAHGYM